MTEDITPQDSKATIHKLHEARREEVRDRFSTRLNNDMSLRMHRAPEEQVGMWKAISSRIFDAVFDAKDFFEHGTPAEYKDRVQEILKNLPQLGIAGDLAQEEYTKIVMIAMEEVDRIVPDEGQRAKLHRAQQQDEQGHWRNPNGRFAKHFEKGDGGIAVETLMDDALVHAQGVKILHEKYRPLFRLIDAEMQKAVWNNSESLQRLVHYANEPGGHTRTQVQAAVRLDLMEEFPQMPMPRLYTAKPGEATPRQIIEDIQKRGFYSIAVRNVLYENMISAIKICVAEEMQNYPDPTALEDIETMKKFQKDVGERFAPMRDLYFEVAEANLSKPEKDRFTVGVDEILLSTTRAMNSYVAQCKESGRGAGQAL